MSRMDRRHFLRVGGAFSALGVGAPLALQLAAAGSAAGQQAPDYRALVCVFLFGGNDAHNTVLATDIDSWTRYFNTRNTGTELPGPAGCIAGASGSAFRSPCGARSFGGC